MNPTLRLMYVQLLEYGSKVVSCKYDKHWKVTLKHEGTSTRSQYNLFPCNTTLTLIYHPPKSPYETPPDTATPLTNSEVNCTVPLFSMGCVAASNLNIANMNPRRTKIVEDQRCSKK